MSQYHFTRANAFAFDLFGQIKGHAYNDAAATPHAGVSYLECDGEHKMATCHSSDLLYYILEGRGTFVIGGMRVEAKATDAVMVPRETEYGYFGQMKYILFMTPNFTEGCETRSDRSPREALI